MLPLHDPASGEGGLDRREAERAADARFVRLLELLPPLTPAGVRLVTRTVAGGIFECLLDTAIELETDLLAVGTRGRGWFATVVLGSTASDVLRRGRRSALMVPPPTAAERIELELRVNGTVEFSRAADWGPVLDAVTHRNAGRTARLEVLGTGIRGGAVHTDGARFLGAAYDAWDARVALMLELSEGRHFTHTVARVNRLMMAADGPKHDLSVAIEHDAGEAVVVFGPGYIDQ